MKRKRIFAIIAASLLVFLLILIAIPYFFMDKINEKLKQEINKRLLATLDYKSFDLSLIRSFPNFTFSLYELKIVGKDQFAKDTLISLDKFSFTLDLMSVLKGNKYEVIGLHLKNPKIYLKVLKDGKANWDIVKPDSVVVEEKQDTTKSFALALKSYSIQNGKIIYNDKQTPMYCEILHLNHKGSGNLMDDVIDLSTQTEIDKFSFIYDGTTYLNQKTINAELNLQLDNKNQKYTFQKNALNINDLALKFDGFLKLNENNIEMDLKFETLKNDFKSILSLVPGIYTESFKHVKTDGQFQLNGFAKGIYSDKQYPAFGLNLKIENGKFQYPDLPLPASDIFVNFKLNNTTGNLDDTQIELKPFRANLGGNPIHIQWFSQGINTIKIESNIKAKIDLAKISQFYPIEKTILKGSFSCNSKINGTYSKTSLPQMQADLSLKYGFIQSEDFPSSIENLNFEASANSTGKYQDTKIQVTNFHADIDKQPIDGHFSVENLDNPKFSADLNGKLDLEKLTKIYPIEGMKLSGIIDIQELKTQGTQSDITAGRYDKVPTSGKIIFNQVVYQSNDYPKIEIKKANFSFTPKEIQVSEYQGNMGSSPVQLNGSLSNYLLYFLKNEKIKGNFSFQSPKFNVNEWMTDDSTPEDKPSSSSLEPVEIPENIDFTLSTNIQELLYDTYSLKNFKGKVIIKDKILTVENADFDLLGGRFTSKMVYNVQNIKKPTIKMNLGLQELQVKHAYQSFEMVKKFVPIAERVEGWLNAQFQYESDLKQDMMPDWATVNCNGIAELFNISAKNFEFINKISNLTKLNNVNEITVKNQKVKFKIEKGRFHVEPFDVKFGDNSMNVSGSSGLDQSLDYLLKLTIPTGQVGQTVVQHLNQWTNKSLSTPQNIKLDLKVTGKMDQPVIVPVGASTDNQIKENLKEEGKQKIEDLKKEAEEKAKAEAERLKREAEEKAKAEAERLKQEAERKKAEAEMKAKEEAERIRQEAERKKAEAEKKAKEEAERLKREAEQKMKDKLKNPFR